VLDMTASPRKTAGQIEMRSGQTRVHARPSESRWGCTLASPGEYDGLIFAAAAMRTVAAVTVEQLAVGQHCCG